MKYYQLLKMTHFKNAGYDNNLITFDYYIKDLNISSKTLS